MIGCLFFTFNACNVIEEQGGDAKLPESVGEFAEMVVLTDLQSAEALKPAITDAFAFDAPGLPPPEEPFYRLRFTDQTYFKGFFQKHFQMIVLLHPENLEIFSKYFSKEDFDRIKNGLTEKEVGIKTASNIWAKPQVVHFIYGNSIDRLKAYLADNRQKLLNRLLKNEYQLGAIKIYGSKIYTDSFFINHYNKDGYGLPKPPSFRVAMNSTDFKWLRKSGKKYDYGIFLYSAPYTSENQFSDTAIVNLRNSFTSKYIEGQLDSTFMIVEPLYNPVFRINSFNGMYCKETRGWWRLKNDYMGGPFLQYSILDEKNNRIITIEGNVFAPNEPKVKHIRELEVILHTLKTK